MIKPIWKSKTFWFNLCAFVVAVGATFTDPVRYGEIATAALIAVALGNIGLRLVTDGPVALRPGAVMAAIGPATLGLIVDELRKRKERFQAEAVVLADSDPRAAQWAEAKAVAMNEAIILIEWILVGNANGNPDPS